MKITKGELLVKLEKIADMIDSIPHYQQDEDRERMCDNTEECYECLQQVEDLIKEMKMSEE